MTDREKQAWNLSAEFLRNRTTRIFEVDPDGGYVGYVKGNGRVLVVKPADAPPPQSDEPLAKIPLPWTGKGKPLYRAVMEQLEF